MASFGHLTKLSSLKNIDIENNFNLTFNIIEEKAKHIAKLQKSINNCNEVILATDDDREGEAIAWHICKLFKLNVNTTKRILFNEITKNALNKSIKNPTVLNLDLINAQQTRQILDLLVGYRISPILWKNISSNIKNSLSAGRCQTPALRLIYDNYLELKDNKGTQVYNTIGYFTDKMFNFNLDYNFDKYKSVIDFFEKSKTFNHILSQDIEKESKRNPPQPFTTSSLQQALYISKRNYENLSNFI
jgi:DNA topoisomerase-1